MRYLYQLDRDPLDGGYAPYEFIPVNMQMDRSFGRRESVMVVPSMDSVLDDFGRLPGPMDRRDQRFSFRRFTNGDDDAEYDKLAAWLAPGNELRLVYQTDSGMLWYTTAANPRISAAETAEGNWGRGGFLDFDILWRIRPDWRLRYSETAEVFRLGTVFVLGTHFGTLGTTTINVDPLIFNIDATGTAGYNLPTIPDTNPTITVTGPAGGDDGLLIANINAPIRDPAGTNQATQVRIPFKLPTANDSVTLKLAPQIFKHGNADFRPIKPKYQPWWFIVMNGVVNSCSVTALGANVVTGGQIKVDWNRKRA